MTEAAPKHPLESMKLGFDYFKHLTTLSSGVIVIVVTLTERLFSEPADKRMAARAIFPLGVCIMTSLFGMAVLAFNAAEGTPPKESAYWIAWAFVMSAIGFVGGLLFISIPLFKTF
jgi:hypothetical protein